MMHSFRISKPWNKPWEKIFKFLPWEKQPVFVVEAKTAPNCWERIKDIYPGVGFQSYYSTKDEALAAKATLKHLLLGKLKGQFQKYPIRIRETS